MTVHKLAVRLFALLLLALPGLAPAQEAEEIPLYSQAELDQMLAPIALYPDELLSQLLMAATYPLEVVEAARWSRAHPELTGQDAVRAVDDREWDPSVKAMVAFPNVLTRMDEDLEWTRRLGDAFLAQQEAVMDTVQALRVRAQDAGNLSSNEYVEVVEQQQTIVVRHLYPEYAYVPYYSPYDVYGTWWWPAYRPVSWSPWAGYYNYPRYGSFYWGPAIVVGHGFFFSDCDWGHRRLRVVDATPFYYRRPPPARGVWVHESSHRRGVPYRHDRVHQRYADDDARPPRRDRSSARGEPEGVTRTRDGDRSNGRERDAATVQGQADSANRERGSRSRESGRPEAGSEASEARGSRPDRSSEGGRDRERSRPEARGAGDAAESAQAPVTRTRTQPVQREAAQPAVRTQPAPRETSQPAVRTQSAPRDQGQQRPAREQQGGSNRGGRESAPARESRPQASYSGQRGSTADRQASQPPRYSGAAQQRSGSAQTNRQRNSAPAQSRESAAAQPRYSASSQSRSRAPEQPRYSASASQSRQSAPQQPRQSAPQQPRYSASASQPRQSAPQQPRYSAPHQARTEQRSSQRAESAGRAQNAERPREERGSERSGERRQRGA